MEWGDLEVILAVCRAGSLSGAARGLGLTHSTVFRKINAIEARTGVRFFDRLPSGYRMTEAGETALVHAERIESEMHALGREVLGQDTRLQGHVRVTAPEGMAAVVLPEVMTAFRREHSEVSIEIVGTVTALDLSRREAEVAIRATRKPPESALGRRVCKFHFGIYGTPDYLRKHEGTPIQDLDWALLSGITAWMVPAVWKKEREAEERMSISSSSVITIINAAAAGAGVTMLPYYLGERDPRLTRVGGPMKGLTLDLWLLTHPDLKHTARVQAVMDHLYEFLRGRREMFEGAD